MASRTHVETRRNQEFVQIGQVIDRMNSLNYFSSGTRLHSAHRYDYQCYLEADTVGADTRTGTNGGPGVQLAMKTTIKQQAKVRGDGEAF